MPTMVQMSVIVTPSARSKRIRARLATPAERVGARCHASSVWRCARVRRMVKEVLRPEGVRPRAIQRPCVIGGEMVTRSVILVYLGFPREAAQWRTVAWPGHPHCAQRRDTGSMGQKPSENSRRLARVSGKGGEEVCWHGDSCSSGWALRG